MFKTVKGNDTLWLTAEPYMWLVGSWVGGNMIRVWLWNDVICSECAVLVSRIFSFWTVGENGASASIFIYSNGLDVHFTVTAIQYLRKHTYLLTEGSVMRRQIDNKLKRWCLHWIPLFDFDDLGKWSSICVWNHTQAEFCSMWSCFWDAE